MTIDFIRLNEKLRQEQLEKQGENPTALTKIAKNLETNLTREQQDRMILIDLLIKDLLNGETLNQETVSKNYGTFNWNKLVKFYDQENKEETI